MPILDYHCHINPEQIANDYRFKTITEAWLGGDHYKWRMMRNAGVDERYITGDASDWEKFLAYAKVLPRAIGNPLYHWTHLELKRYWLRPAHHRRKRPRDLRLVQCKTVRSWTWRARHY